MELYSNVHVLDYGDEIEVRSLPVLSPLPGVVSGHKRRRSLSHDGFTFVSSSFEDLDINLTAEDFEDMERASLDAEYYEKYRKKESRRRSLNRSRSMIYSLARGYQWQYFLTFTFSPDVVDRYDYSAVSSLMQLWLNNMRKQSPDMRYILVPELHKDGAFHFHGLISGCSSLRLQRHNRKIFNVLSFPYGFSTASRVESSERASNYITKYITKELVAVTFGKKRYWRSRNIKRPDVVRLFIPREEKKSFFAFLLQVVRYTSTVVTEVGEMVYFHLKREDFEAVAIEHSIQNYISSFCPPPLLNPCQ